MTDERSERVDREASWQEMKAVNGREVAFVSSTFSSQQRVPDELFQVLGSFMNPVSVVFNLLSISRHLSGLHTHTHKQKSHEILNNVE